MCECECEYIYVYTMLCVSLRSFTKILTLCKLPIITVFLWPWISIQAFVHSENSKTHTFGMEGTWMVCMVSVPQYQVPPDQPTLTLTLHPTAGSLASHSSGLIFLLSVLSTCRCWSYVCVEKTTPKALVWMNDLLWCVESWPRLAASHELVGMSEHSIPTRSATAFNVLVSTAIRCRWTQLRWPRKQSRLGAPQRSYSSPLHVWTHYPHVCFPPQTPQLNSITFSQAFSVLLKESGYRV